MTTITLKRPGRAALLATAIAAAMIAADRQPMQFKVEFTKPAAAGKGATLKGELSLDTDARKLAFSANGERLFEIPYANVTSLQYERTSKPRYAAGLLIAWPLLFTKSKQHYLTVHYKSEDGRGQFALLRLDKTNYAQVLAAVEAETRTKVERTEER